ncbi:MAG: EamA family transporter [Rouxiella badensis]|uniref:DMT family transporter n=1 Tax=Rouxiella badensis TaxID=1646377 RepID=UPI000370142C|nr:EamA family transporter [Rouxiella badensis]
MTISSDRRFGGITAVLIAAILWGTTGTAATFAPQVSSVAIGSVAMGVGGLLQALIALRSLLRFRHALGQQWRLLIVGALAVAVYPLAFYASMRMAGVTVGTLVSIGSAPLLSALIEYCLEGQRLSLRWMAGASLGIVGMLLLCLAKNTGHGATSEMLPGILTGLIAGLTYALYSWAARQLMQRGVPSKTAMGATFGVGGILLMPVLFATGAPLLASWNNAAVGAYMALVPMFIGYLCFGFGLARIPASMATTLTLLEPVVAAVLAVIIVGERLTPQGWLGIALVGICLVLITAPAKRNSTLSESRETV